MITYLIRRTLIAIPVLFFVILITFILVHAMPGGPFDISGNGKPPSPELIAILEQKYGLDKPVSTQFFLYTSRLLRGDLGPMFKLSSQSVNSIVAESFPVSIQLGLLSIGLGFLIGVPLGIIAALKHNSWIDHGATIFAILGASIPNLVLAPILILVFGVWLKEIRGQGLPFVGWGAEPPFILGFLPRLTKDFFLHAILPTFALGTAYSATIARLTRAGLLDVLNNDYIRTARAKGLRERIIILIHALKNSLIPLATILGPLLAGAVTGAFITETIFAINGMGRWFLNSINQREYFLLTSLTLIFAVLLVLGNIMVDVLYVWLDPRIRFD